MATVHVITTGRMEQKALAASLQAIFPGHIFTTHERIDGITSAPLPPDRAALALKPNLRPLVDKFAATLLGLFAPGRRQDRPRPDFVLAVDDLELVNAHAPENVTFTVRDAIERNLESWRCETPARDRLREQLRTRCSFHLMAPMTEAYFFADPAALARATDPGPDHPVQFDATTSDLEEFMVADDTYLAERPDVDGWCTKKNRGRHPKHYLEYLTDAKLDGSCRYDENTGGAAALRSLAWATILAPEARPAEHARFARSLFADLHHMLDEDTGALAALDRRHCHPLTWPPPASPVLRNL